MSDLGVGIIGCGNISTAYLTLAPIFRGLDVRAVADLDPHVAQKQAEAFDVRPQTVQDLLASDDIDVVVNLTVPAAHFAVTSDILSAGKHAYSEKPLALSLDQGLTLQSLAAELGVRVGSAPDTFLGGAHQQARALIDRGAIGDVVAGTAHVMSRGMESWHPTRISFSSRAAVRCSIWARTTSPTLCSFWVRFGALQPSPAEVSTPAPSALVRERASACQ